MQDPKRILQRIIRWAMAPAALAMLIPAVWAQKQLAGEWKGTLETDGGPVSIRWHVAANQDGTLTSTFDNDTEGVTGIKAKSIELKGDTLTVVVDDSVNVNGSPLSIHGTMTAKLSSDGNEVKGTWTQDSPQEETAPIDLKREAAAASQPAQSAAAPASTQIAGDWTGVLMGQLHLVLHIHAAPDGALSATLDSVDQGANGIPVSKVTLADGKLNLEVPAVQGTYSGVLSKDGTALDGTWSQGSPMPLAFKRSTDQTKPVAPVPPTDIDGIWMGTLDMGAMKLRLVIRIYNTATGLAAGLRSPDQGGGEIAASSISRDGSTLKFSVKSLNVDYTGTIAADKTAIDGTFTQNGMSRPLLLKPVKDAAEAAPKQRNRPQNPVKPYPYKEEDVSYKNEGQGDVLAATLTIPNGPGPFPAVVLITGSGPQDRDETLLGHKPFLVLSGYLTRHGIEVLRADDRGTGKSTGKFEGATTADFATDTEAGIAFLKTRPEVNQHKIGLIGHSEGGEIAPMIAARNRDVAYIVMLAGPGVPGDAIVAEQQKLIALAEGESAAKVDAEIARLKQVLALVENEKDDAVVRQKAAALAGDGQSKAELDLEVKSFTTPWFRYFLTYDPAGALRKVKCPVLALNGSLDLQVPPAQNLPAIREALRQGGNKHAEVDELPGLNHLLQTAKTGSPSEYIEIEETMSPVALEKIAGWIVKQ